MTLEDFAHRCLMIKAGNAELAIPCCANCEHYTEVITGQEVRGNVITGFKLINTSTEWLCLHPEIDSDDSAFCWVAMKPEDFCSRWEERNGSN